MGASQLTSSGSARKVVVIGAGRVGLGCAARIAAAAGLEVVVLARGATARQLSRHGEVVVRCTDGRFWSEQTVQVRAVDCVNARFDAIVEIGEADVVFTAVGANAVPQIVPLLAAGLRAARTPVDVITLENREDAATVLRKRVIEVMSPQVEHGFSGAVVDGVVARRVAGSAHQPVTITAEQQCEVTVDADVLVSDWTWLPHIRATSNFRAAYRRKLYRYSTGHATAAYLGQIKGYRYIHAAMADPEVAWRVMAAMEEGRRGLLHRYGPEVAGSRAELYGILDRFSNAALGDTTERVGADVARKLARSERLVGAARLARKAGVAPQSLPVVIAAALRDELLASQGTDLRASVAEVIEMKRSSWLTSRVCDELQGLSSGALLSIGDGTPAWELRGTQAAS